jgi:hypothetical protein
LLLEQTPRVYSSSDIRSAIQELITGTSAQYPAAVAFVDKVKTKNGVKIAQLSGYSQSGYMLKVGIDNNIKTTVFNGFYNYSDLTKAELDKMRENPMKFANYSFDSWGNALAFVPDFTPTGLLHDYTSGKINRENIYPGLVLLPGGAHSPLSLFNGHFWPNGNILQDGLIFTPKNFSDYSKNDYNKIVAPKIKNLKTMLVGGSLSGTQRIAIETELVSYTARALRDQTESWYDDANANLKKLQDAAKRSDEALIQKIKDSGGNLMSQAEAKQLFYEYAGYNKYDANLYDDLSKQIKNAYQKKLKIAEQMESLVEKSIEHDSSAARDIFK